MPARTIVQIAEDGQMFTWVSLDEHSQPIDSPTSGFLEQLAQAGVQATLIALLPSIDLLLTTAELPKTSATKLRQAAPYALEEELADNVELLHFALGDWENNGIAVGVIEQKKLQAWIDEFKRYGLSLDAIIPDVLALPLYPLSWSLYIDDRSSLLRVGIQAGMFVDNDNLEPILRSFLHNEVYEPPQKIYVWNSAKIDISSIKKFNVEIEENTTPIKLIQLAAETINPDITLNFLQGELKPTHKKSIKQKQWRLAAILGITWLAVLLFSNIIQYAYFSYQETRVAQQITGLYQQVFPGQTDISSAKSDVEKELRNLIYAAQGSRFLRLLAKVGKPWLDDKNIQVTQFNYQDNKLVLQLTVPSFTNLDTLTRQLKNVGLNVQQSNVSTVDKAVQAQLTVQ